MWDKLTREERIKRIQAGVRDGLSAAQIAASIGGCTRNAVIGLALRANVMLGTKITLAGSTPAVTRAKATKERPTSPHVPPKPNQPKPADRQVASAPQRRVEVAPRPLSSRIDNSVLPVSRRLSLVELNDKVCRWPEGDPQDLDFHFCGNGTDGVARYCGYHCRIAYVPAAERKRLR